MGAHRRGFRAFRRHTRAFPGFVEGGDFVLVAGPGVHSPIVEVGGVRRRFADEPPLLSLRSPPNAAAGFVVRRVVPFHAKVGGR